MSGLNQRRPPGESGWIARGHLLTIGFGLAIMGCAGNEGRESSIAGGATGAGGASGSSAAGSSGSGGMAASLGGAGGTLGGAGGTLGGAGGGSGVFEGAGGAGVGGSSATGGAGGNGQGGAAGGGGAPATRCTGKLGAPGLTTRDIAGHNVLVHIPATVDPNAGVPLLLVHHGFLMDGEGMRALTGYQAIADREGFVVAFPTGTGNTWNVGTGVCGGAALVSGTGDDLSFVRAMISNIEADQCLSREHVFMTGFSMGAYFSNHVACQMSDVVRAVASHSGGTYPGSCPGGPVPVMLWHGTADGTVDPNCSRTARDVWVARNGCQATFDTVQVTNGTCEWSHGCPPGGQVVLCMMTNMNHQWAGGSGLVGAPGYENASEMIWTFFKNQSGL